MSAEAAATLRRLHQPGRPLVLPNVWDAHSARLVQEAGFPVVATSSDAVAAALGFEDGEKAPVDQMFAAAERIVRAVSVPVTVDVESGYQLEPEELVTRLVAVGAAGCNLEDTDHRTGRLVDVDEQARRLAAVRAAADRAGVPLVLNARVDVLLHAKITGDTRPESELVGEAVRRGRRYLEAGADCVYPILALEEETVRKLVDELPGPVNALLSPQGPSLATLAELGVARVSLGPYLFRAAEDWLRGELGNLSEQAGGDR